MVSEGMIPVTGEEPLPTSLAAPDAIAGAVDSLTTAQGGTVLPAPKEPPTRVRLELDGDSLQWEDLIAILEAEQLDVRLSDLARERMAASRAGAVELLERRTDVRAYGWNQALGPLKDRVLTASEQRQFQVNVLRSHAAGIGEYLSTPIARLAMVIRANVLARGTTGVRPELVDRLLSLLNSGIVPLMPEVGSLGTGDLQPMAAAGLCLIGEDVPAADVTGMTRAPEALRRAGLDDAFIMEAGEAIAFISGSAVLCACLIAVTRRVESQLDTFLGAFSLFCEATRAEVSAFDRRLHHERRIPLEVTANERILALIGDSQWMTHAGRIRLGEVAPRVQDPTSVRGTPHKVASVAQSILHARRELEWEVNASTANPLVLPDGRGGYDFVSGGNWDCTMLGHSAHALNVHVTDLAVLTKDLSGRLGSELWSNGLPTSLSGGKVGLNSGMTLVNAVGASLIPEMHVRSTPVGSLSFPVKGGQEDHNTMAMASVRNLVSNLDRLDVVLGVLLLMSAQGIDLIADRMAGLERSDGASAVHAAVRRKIEPLGDDRYMTDDIKESTSLVRRGVIAATVREFTEHAVSAPVPQPLRHRSAAR